MGILDSGPEEPQSKVRRYVISGIAFVLLLALGFWYLFRFYAETRVVATFFDTLVAGDTQRAYQLWHGKAAAPPASYTYKDFVDDWGPSGYYGPVKSFHIQSASNPRNGGSGVIVIVEVSPFQPFPADNDVEKNRRTKVVHLWVEKADRSLSFPP